MKYTKYILKKDLIDIDNLISEKDNLKPISVTIAVPVAITGFIFIGGMLPICLTADSARYAKYFYYKLHKKIKKSKTLSSCYSNKNLKNH